MTQEKNKNTQEQQASLAVVGLMVALVVGGGIGFAIWGADKLSHVEVNMKKTGTILPAGAQSIVAPVLIPGQR